MTMCKTPKRVLAILLALSFALTASASGWMQFRGMSLSTNVPNSKMWCKLGCLVDLIMAPSPSALAVNEANAQSVADYQEANAKANAVANSAYNDCTAACDAANTGMSDIGDATDYLSFQWDTYDHNWDVVYWWTP